MKNSYNVAIVGATGAVGLEFLKVLDERKFPIDEIRLFASPRSEGRRLLFKKKRIVVKALNKDSFNGIDIAFFSAGSYVSKEYSLVATRKGAIVIDNSPAFRMNPEVPLVVPEVNPSALNTHQGLISNPNCCVIPMTVVLNPIHQKADIKRIIVSTYQAVSGTGLKAMDELKTQSKILLSNKKDKKIEKKIYPHQIAFNCLPHIGKFRENGYTDEEMKIVDEIRKIMNIPNLAITATTVRVPVLSGHSMSVYIETYKKLNSKMVQDILSNSPSIKVLDDPSSNTYPMPISAVGKDVVLVGRIREDLSTECGINLWISSDNVRKGAALNAVQIAETLLK